MEKAHKTKNPKENKNHLYFLLGAVIIAIAILAYPSMVGRSINKNEKSEQIELDDCLDSVGKVYSDTWDKISNEQETEMSSLREQGMKEPFNPTVVFGMAEYMELRQKDYDQRFQELKDDFEYYRNDCYKRYK